MLLLGSAGACSAVALPAVTACLLHRNFRAVTPNTARGAPASAPGWTLLSVMLLLGSAGTCSAVALPAVMACGPPVDMGAGMGMLCPGMESSARAGSGPVSNHSQPFGELLQVQSMQMLSLFQARMWTSPVTGPSNASQLSSCMQKCTTGSGAPTLAEPWSAQGTQIEAVAQLLGATRVPAGMHRPSCNTCHALRP